MIRLIDSTPVPLSRFFDFARANGRIHGMKMHLAHDPCANRPMRVEVTPANVNDIAVGKKTPIEAGATYVFDKGYCDYAWWTHIAATGAFFVTRPKNTMRLKVLAARPLEAAQSVDADGFTVIEDAEVALTSKGDSKLPMRLRRIIVEREDARRGAKRRITLIVNDMRAAVPMRSPRSTRAAGRSSCCFDGSSSTSTSGASSAKARTPCVCNSWPP